MSRVWVFGVGCCCVPAKSPYEAKGKRPALHSYYPFPRIQSQLYGTGPDFVSLLHPLAFDASRIIQLTSQPIDKHVSSSHSPNDAGRAGKASRQRDARERVTGGGEAERTRVSRPLTSLCCSPAGDCSWTAGLSSSLRQNNVHHNQSFAHTQSHHSLPKSAVSSRCLKQKSTATDCSLKPLAASQLWQQLSCLLLDDKAAVILKA